MLKIKEGKEAENRREGEKNIYTTKASVAIKYLKHPSFFHFIDKKTPGRYLQVNISL